MEFKGHDERPKEKARDLYREAYYGALTPQQVKDYLGKDDAPLPVTYTVGPALNVVLWTGEGVLTGLVGTASAVSLLFEQLQQKPQERRAADDSAKQASAER